MRAGRRRWLRLLGLLGLKLSFLDRRFAHRLFLSNFFTSSSYSYSSPEEITTPEGELSLSSSRRTHLEEDYRTRSSPCSAEALRLKKELRSFQPQEAADFQLWDPCSMPEAYPEQPNRGRSNPPTVGPRGWLSSRQRRSPLHNYGSVLYLSEPEPRDPGSPGLCRSHPQNKFGSPPPVP